MISIYKVSYRSHGRAFKNISFNLPKGESAIILGPHRSGKSDFLRLCIGALQPLEGKVMLGGEDVALLRQRGHSEILRKTGYITQEPSLLDNLTVAANVGLPISYHRGLEFDEMLEIIKPYLEKFNLMRIAKKFPNEICQDDAKMAQVARALIEQPDLLILDEPTSGDLDPEGFGRIMSAINDAHNNGMTLLLSTCSPSLAATPWMNCYFVVKGRLVPHSEAHKEGSPKIKAYLREIEKFAERQMDETARFFKKIIPTE